MSDTLKNLPLCKVCNQTVDMSIAGETVNSNGKHWHGFCYKAQEKIDQYKANWEECVERLNTRAAPTVKPLVWEETHFGWVSGPYEVWGDDDDAMIRMNGRQFRHKGGKPAAQEIHDTYVRAYLEDAT